MSSVRQKRAEVHKAEAREAERLRVQGGDIVEKIEESHGKSHARTVAERRCPSLLWKRKVQSKQRQGNVCQ